MRQKDKELLLKDLCARLPYGVKCKILETGETKILASINYDRENTLFDFWEDSRKIQYEYQLYLSEFKPYLFPMSSMTDEQQNDLTKFVANGIYNENIIYDWYNKNHFDYRGLIDKELAIDCTNLNIY